jgi:hypothetical protein
MMPSRWYDGSAQMAKIFPKKPFVSLIFITSTYVISA